MNQKKIEMIAGNPVQKWFYNQGDVAKLLGCERHQAARFLREQSVPYYRLWRAKVYFLPEVLSAAEKTRWAS